MNVGNVFYWHCNWETMRLLGVEFILLFLSLPHKRIERWRYNREAEWKFHLNTLQGRSRPQARWQSQESEVHWTPGQHWANPLPTPKARVSGHLAFNVGLDLHDVGMKPHHPRIWGSRRAWMEWDYVLRNSQSKEREFSDRLLKSMIIQPKSCLGNPPDRNLQVQIRALSSPSLLIWSTTEKVEQLKKRECRQPQRGGVLRGLGFGIL